MSKLFNESMMQERKDLKDWKSCVEEGVNILVEKDYATPKLADAIFESTNKFGAYYVLERGIALLHAAPGPYAKKMGVSFILLDQEVQFNDEDKYARLIFTLSAPDSKSHIGVIEEFGKLFTNEETKKKLLQAKTIEEIKLILKSVEGEK